MALTTVMKGKNMYLFSLQLPCNAKGLLKENHLRNIHENPYNFMGHTPSRGSPLIYSQLPTRGKITSSLTEALSAMHLNGVHIVT